MKDRGGNDKGGAGAVDQPRKKPTKPASATLSVGVRTASPLSSIGSDTGSYQRAESVRAEGATSPDGRPWIKLIAGHDRYVWAPLDEFAGDAAAVRKRLLNERIILFDDDLARALAKGRAITQFPRLPLIEAPGWTGPYFSLPSGEVFSPPGSPPPVVLFSPSPYKCNTRGGKGWKQGLAGIAANQPLLTFGVAIAFAPPLLRLSRVLENFGFELHGPKGRGKTTLQHLIASVAGPALEPIGKNFWINANSTTNALEAEMPMHSDSVMVIDEMSAMYAGESERVRGARYREFVFMMTQGTGKDRYGTSRQRPSRFVYVLSINEPMSKLMSTSSEDIAAAATDRLLGLPISKKARGIFVKPLPKGCKDSEDAARAISTMISRHYGWPIRKFLRGLVAARAADEQALSDKIEQLIRNFRDAAGVGGNVGSEARIADAFGLVYAAGKLAKIMGHSRQTLTAERRQSGAIALTGALRRPI